MTASKLEISTCSRARRDTAERPVTTRHASRRQAWRWALLMAAGWLIASSQAGGWVIWRKA
jgi:hypothetical protein